MMNALVAVAGGYLLGSVPFGLVLTRLAGYGDIRRIGSGNIGATNVLRTGNKPLALATLLLDGGKGAAAVGLAMLAGLDNPELAAFAAVIGHLFPVWLSFKGGKGVATTLGTLLALSPTAGAAACLTWLVMAKLYRYSSLAALVAMASAPLWSFLFAHNPVIVFWSAVVAVVVWVRHKDNIKRLLAGSEPKIGEKKPHDASVSAQQSQA